MKQTLVIPCELPTFNETIASSKQHWARYDERKQKSTEQIAYLARQQLVLIDGHCHFSFIWHCKEECQHPANIASAKALIIDGLVTAGILKEGSWRYVAGFSDAFAVDKANPRVEVSVGREGAMRVEKKEDATAEKSLVQVGDLPARLALDAHIKQRMVALLSQASEDWREQVRVREMGRDGSYRWRWWLLRRRIGGRVKAAMFRRLIDELAAEGVLIEVWDLRHRRWDAAHFVLCPEHFDKHEWTEIVQAKGRADVLQSLHLDALPRKKGIPSIDRIDWQRMFS